MAKVEMDLNELKALETKIANLETEKADLIDKQKMVVVLHKYFTGVAKPGKVKTGSVKVTGIREVYEPNSWRYGGGSTRRAFEEDMSISYAIDAGFIDVQLKEDATRVSKDYINLSEVTEELRGVIGAEYDQRLAEARERATKAESELASIDDTHIKRIRVMNEGYQNDIVKLKKDHDKEVESLNTKYNELVETSSKAYNELQQDYQDLKDDKKRISLEQQVAEMSAQIKALQTRGFWARVFNTK